MKKYKDILTEARKIVEARKSEADMRDAWYSALEGTELMLESIPWNEEYLEEEGVDVKDELKLWKKILSMIESSRMGGVV